MAEARKEVTVTRVIDAPRELVFEAWTKPRHLSQWFGPNGFSVPASETDFREGGRFRLCMRSPQGEDFWSQGTYREIAAPERLVFTSALLDDNGKPRFETLASVTFDEKGKGTELAVHAKVMEIYDPSAQGALSGMEQGWKQTIDRLAAYVVNHLFKSSSKREVSDGSQSSSIKSKARR